MGKYSVHESMSAVDISIVMDHREKIGRKLDEQEIGHVLREISYRFLRGYTGDFPYLLNMKQRLDQYGRLFASQSAGVLNCLVAEATKEIQQSIRQHAKEQKSTGKTKRLSVQLGTVSK